MREYTETEIERITIAVNSYNNSPWVFDEDRVSLESYLTPSETSTADSIVENLRRADIRAYRAEEAACGNI